MDEGAGAVLKPEMTSGSVFADYGYARVWIETFVVHLGRIGASASRRGPMCLRGPDLRGGRLGGFAGFLLLLLSGSWASVIYGVFFV